MSGRIVVTIAAASLLVAIVAVSLVVGTRPTTAAEVVDALRGTPTVQPDLMVIVWDQRIPRTVLGIAVGAAMALAGATIQGHTRNPLADPGILGISSGAAFAVVLSVFAFGVGSQYALVWSALAGALLAAGLVFLLSLAGGGGGSPLTLILAGAALTAFFTAMTTLVILRDRASLDQLRLWNTGSLSGRDLSILGAVAPFLLVGCVLALASAPALNALAVGVDTARSLGIHVTRTRIVGLLSVTLLAGAGTAAAGPLAFIGLVVPHAVRVVAGPDHRWLLPLSALTGASLVLVADVLGRVILRPAEIQAGVLLAVVGVPVFVALVRRRSVVSL